MDSQLINDRAEARLEELAATHDFGAEWRGMVNGMHQEASQLALDSVMLATQGGEAGLASQALSERFEDLAERLQGVGLADVAEGLSAGIQDAARGDYDGLARASEAAMDASAELSKTAELAREFSRDAAIPVGDVSTIAEAGAPDEAAGESKYADKYGRFGNSSPLSGLMDLVDSYREGAGLPSLRESSVLFRSLDEIAADIGEAMRKSPELSTVEKAESVLTELATAQVAMDKAQDAFAKGGETEALMDKVMLAQADLTRAESNALTALDQLATELNAPTAQQPGMEGVSAGEATMQQFLEAGGVVTPEIVQDVSQAESLAGLTVRELGSMDEAMLQDLDHARDASAMLENLANHVDNLGLTDMADGLRDAANATLDGAGSVDFDAVKDFVSDSARTLSELGEAAQAFSFGEGELTRDTATLDSGLVEAGMVAQETVLSNDEFASLFESTSAPEGLDATQAEAEAEVEMEMSS